MRYWLALLVVASAFNTAATVTPLPGVTPQTVGVGDNLAPIRVLVTNASGQPVAGTTVYWGLFTYRPDYPINLDRGPNCFLDLGIHCRVTTDSNGIAQLYTLYATRAGSTTFSVRAGSEADNLGDATIQVTVLPRSIPPGTSFQGTWWAGPGENGWGVSIAQGPYYQLFTVLFAYDEAGKPTWHAMDRIGWNGVPGDGPLYSPRGSPYFAYDVNRFVPGPPQGTVNLQFHSDKAATVRLSEPLHGQFARKPVVPFVFDAEQVAPLTGLDGLWWGGPSQAGWAVSLDEGGGGLFGLWLTYDENGERTWFSLPSGSWSGTTYSGTIYRTRGPSWPNYDPSDLRVEAVGTFSLAFQDVNNANFSWSIGPHAQAIPILRVVPY